MKKLFQGLAVVVLVFLSLIPSSVFALDWTETQPIGDVNNGWPSVASDADGSNLVVGGRGVAYGRLYTSDDGGDTWIERQPAGDVGVTWEALASDSDGSNIIAGVTGGRLYVSTTTGATWTEVQPAGDVDADWQTVASDADGSNLIAGINNGRLYTSDDSGATWTERQPGGDVDWVWYSVASDDDGTNLIAAAGSAGTGRLFTSGDGGDTWTERQPEGDVGKDWRSVASDADGSNLLAGVTGGRLYTSDDSGDTWTERQPAGNINGNWASASSDSDGSYLIVGSNNRRLYVSSDSGASWTEEQPAGATNLLWSSVAVDADGTNLIVGIDSGLNGRLYISVPEAIAPTVSSFDPADEAINVNVDAVFEITFDEDIATSTGDITLHLASDDSITETIDVAGPKVTQGAANMITIDPTTSLEPGSAYYFLIDAGAVEDLVGNEFAGISDETTWNFTTAVPVALDFERVSVGDGDVETNNNSQIPTISTDGRYVAFEAIATNLVADDTNDVSDIFVYDRTLDTVERVSVDSEGVEGNGDSVVPSISADGRYVAFESDATNLVATDTNALRDIFVYDRTLDTVERVSVDDVGGEGDSISQSSTISSDGRYVAFQSQATNLVASDTNGVTDVFVFDRDLNTLERVSRGSLGEEGDISSFNPAISSNGRYVAFHSESSTFVADDTNGFDDIFVFDRDTDTVERVSVSDLGAEGDGGSNGASLSSDGRYVAFSSDATDLVAGDTNGLTDIFVYDRTLNTVERIGDDSEYSADAVISGDGRYVVFRRSTDNADGSYYGIYRYDRNEDVLLYVTEGALNAGDETAVSSNPSISEDGLILAFDSIATNLVDADINGYTDVFVYEEIEVEPEPEPEPEPEEDDSSGGTSSHRHSTSGETFVGQGTDALVESLMAKLLTLLQQLLLLLQSQQ